MKFYEQYPEGSQYKDFAVVSVDQLKDFKAVGVYLRHKSTGLEVYHIINDDEENLFSLNFRTLAKNSYGAAHIMEHSVLCGSEKFPLKEPFTTLENQSVKSFLNAMTYPDKTSYPAASLIQSDYFNLMDVYADAVFFPKLSRHTFMQEGWRLEMDDKEKLSIQGVVYNEMKAKFSAFNQVAIDSMIDTMYPDSVYCYESGGDPLEIPNLTYENWLEFHKKFYSPSNCLLFLYGNIPTQLQLDFIAEKYIPRLEKAYPAPVISDLYSKTPFISDEIKNLQKTACLEKSVSLKAFAPDNGATGSMVCRAWYTGSYDIENTYLSEVLSGNDSSPISKILQESGLGDDLAPVCGNFGYVHNNNFMAWGLSGVKKGNEKKVFDLIQSAVEKVYKEGLSEDDINSAIMGIDFNLREVGRHFGPFSIVLMSKALAGWTNGLEPKAHLSPISDFEIVKEKLASDPDYTKKLIKKYFIDSPVHADLVVEPSKKYFEERNAKEKALLSDFEKNTDREKLKIELAALHAYQAKEESPEELSCIPHLKLSQLTADINHIKTELSSVKSDDGDINLVLSDEATNGIVYVDVAFPIDNVAPEDFKYLPLMIDSLTDLGWNGKKWNLCTTQMACVMGDVGTRTIIGELPDSDYSRQTAASYKDKNIAGRSWVSISAKFLSHKTEESLKMLSEIISKMSFDDVKRMETILAENQLDRKSNFIHHGTHYLSLRGRAYYNKASAMSELFYGVSQYFWMNSYKKKDVASLLKKFKSLYEDILSQGCVIHVTSDSDSIKKVTSVLENFVKEAGLKSLKASKGYSLKDYIPFIYQSEPENQQIEAMKIKTQTGFAAAFFPCSIWLTKEAAAEDILSTWLNGHQLWEKIRMTGGAYGGSCSPDSTDKIFSMMSWRDPTPVKSLDLFIESLQEVCEKKFTQEEVECCIISNYSDEIVPDSPSQRGVRGFNRFLFGTRPEMIQKRLEDTLKVTPEDVHQAALRLLENSKKCRRLIICDKSTEFCGKVIQI